ncbi:MAG: baseplate J/gp47 family protein [Christensenellaceae bacterium]
MSTYSDMIERLTTAASKAAGSLATDNIAAVAVELDRIREELEAMPARFFPTMASGEDLTAAAANFGVNRREATRATVTLAITGEAGAEITLDTCAAAGNVVFCAVEEAVFENDGVLNVEFEALDPGEQGNVEAGTITEFSQTYSGLLSVTNAAAAKGGADEEDDETLLERVRTKWAAPSTGGNLADYKRWAIDVPGVSDAYVENPSAGNVTAYIVGAGNAQADEDLLQAVRDNIEANRSVGARVTVLSGEPVTINITANVKLVAGYTAAGVKALIEDAAREWLEDLTFEAETVNYVRAATLLFVDGVSEITSYALNGEKQSVALTKTQFPVLGEVTINVDG